MTHHVSRPEADRPTSNAARSGKYLTFTLGSDIFFSGKAPSGNDRSGQKLRAHELTHTLQQGGSAARAMRQVRRSPLLAAGSR